MGRLQCDGEGLLQRRVDEMVVDELVAIQIGKEAVASEEEENAAASVLLAGKDDRFVRRLGDDAVAVDQLVANGSTHGQSAARALLVREDSRHVGQVRSDVVLADRPVALLDAAFLLGKERRVDDIDVAIFHDMVTLLDRHVAPTLTGGERTHSESPTLRL